MAGLSMQLQLESTNDFQNGIEAGAAFSGRCLVETFAEQPCIASNLRHAFLTITKSENRGPSPILSKGGQAKACSLLYPISKTRDRKPGKPGTDHGFSLFFAF